MALAIDGSTPAIVTQATGSIATVTTASFTPPAGSVLLVMHSGNTVDPNNPGDPTITDSLGAHLTYTKWDSGHRPDSPTAEGQVTTWTAPVASSAAMTVTVTTGAVSPNRHAALCVMVITGADTVNPVGAHGKNSSLSAASIAQNFTGTASGSWGFLVVNDWAAKGAETAGTGCTLIGSANIGAPDISYGFFRRTTADGTNGGTTTMNATIPGTSTSLRWAWVEMIPAAAVGTAPAPVIVSPDAVFPIPVPVPIPGAQIITNRPLGIPAVQAPTPLYVISKPYDRLIPPRAYLSTNRPLGNPAVPTAQPLVVVSKPYDRALPTRAQILAPQVAASAPPTGNITFDQSGTTAVTVGTTSTTVDITAAAVGAWCYVWVALGANSGAVSGTGWTSLLDADEGTAAHYALLRRQKQSGDTTFSLGWTTSTKGTLSWVSYTGLDPVTPDEQATLATNGVTSRTAVPTPTATPTSNDRWAVGFFANRTTTVGNKPITYTPDAAQTERIDADNNAAGSAPWVGTEIADTNAAVTAAPHSYTATHNAAESHDGSAILFLIPGAVTASAATPLPLVVSPPFRPVSVPPLTLSASQPLGNPAVGTPEPLVVTPPFQAVPIPGARLFVNPPAPVVSTVASPQPLVVTPPFARVPVPPVTLSASQPLGNPAVGTPGPLVVTPSVQPVPVPGARLYAAPGQPVTVATSTPQPLVVVPAFTLAPVPGARIFGAPSTVAAPAPLVVTPPFRPVPIPGARVTASFPLGRPAVGNPQPLVVTPPWRPVAMPRTYLLANVREIAVIDCDTHRPTTGSTSRPSTGTTLYDRTTIGRPGTGVTTRPDTGETDPPCGAP